MDIPHEVSDPVPASPAYNRQQEQSTGQIPLARRETLPLQFGRTWKTSTVPAPSLAQQERDRAVYPESDGQPIAENTLQFDWIELVKGGIEAMFADVPDVFVAADLFWYPDESNPRLRVAPDVMVAFGRPKGTRYSYLQWREDHIAPQVVWEIRSPANSDAEMQNKQALYKQYGVLEYYEYHPSTYAVRAFTRPNAQVPFVPVSRIQGFVSPVLGIRFDREPTGELVLFDRQGRRLVGIAEAIRQRAEAKRRAARFAEQLRALGITPDEDEA
jgi:Uma2 family endonuclease